MCNIVLCACKVKLMVLNSESEQNLLTGEVECLGHVITSAGPELHNTTFRHWCEAH